RRRERRLLTQAGPRLGGAVRGGMGRDVVRGARLVGGRRAAAPAAGPRPRRARGRGGGVRLRRARPRQPRRRGRLPAGGRDALRRDHGLPPCRRACRGAWARPLRALRPGGVARRLLRGAALPPPRVVPRPPPRRGGAVRRRARARGRPVAAGSVSARKRPGAAMKVATKDSRFRTRPVGTLELDARRLARELAAVVEGEVRFSPGSRALYTTGGSNYRQVPIGIVIPRSVEDVVSHVAVCREHGAPVLSRGGGTSLAGQVTNVAVVLDFSKYLNQILELDADRRLARVQPGLILDHLRNTAERQHRLTYGPDPSTHSHCTLGGMIGNNSCGVHSVMTEFHGSGPLTADQVVELDVL